MRLHTIILNYFIIIRSALFCHICLEGLFCYCVWPPPPVVQYQILQMFDIFLSVPTFFVRSFIHFSFFLEFSVWFAPSFAIHSIFNIGTLICSKLYSSTSTSKSTKETAFVSKPFFLHSLLIFIFLSKHTTYVSDNFDVIWFCLAHLCAKLLIIFNLYSFWCPIRCVIYMWSGMGVGKIKNYTK